MTGLPDTPGSHDGDPAHKEPVGPSGPTGHPAPGTPPAGADPSTGDPPGRPPSAGNPPLGGPSAEEPSAGARSAGASSAGAPASAASAPSASAPSTSAPTEGVGDGDLGGHRAGAGAPGAAPMPETFAVRVPDGYRVGDWEVLRPLASGAFGSVYAARRTGSPGQAGVDGGTPGTAALKFLSTGTRTPRQLRHLHDLAQRELALHRKLRRPRLIRMYEALTVDDPDAPELDGSTVLVLEQAQTSLDQLLAASPVPAAGPALLTQVCEGLAQLHTAGWVHGDLKPGNVLLMPDGTVRLGDFNLASELDGTHAYAPAFATPDYTPPELLWTEVDERGHRIRTTADIWAFGVLAHLVLTGSLPWPGGTPSARRDAAVRYARGNDVLRLSPELPDSWRQIVTGCLAPAHEQRSRHEATRLLTRLREVTGPDTSVPSPDLPGPPSSPGSPGSSGSRLVFPVPVTSTDAAAGTDADTDERGSGDDGTGRHGRPGRQLLVAAAATAALLAGSLGYLVGDTPDRPRPPRPTGPAGAAPSYTAGSPAPPSRYGAAELRTDVGVPVRYRRLVVDAAHSCADPDVTPALIAALLKTESNFDPDLRDPDAGASGEYGIARWSPHVLLHYLDEKDRPEDGSNPRPPFPPEMSIPAVGRYLCRIAPRLHTGLPEERPVLIATAYRTSAATVNREGGVPDRHRDYADRIARHLEKYTPRGAT